MATNSFYNLELDEKPKSLQECFERLKKGCEMLSAECNYSEDYSSFNPPATEEQIKEFESALKYPLPVAYREFLKFSNGSREEMTSRRMAISLEDGELSLFWDLKEEPCDFEHELMKLLKDCELEITSIKKQQENAKKDPESLKKEAEDVVSKWRKFHIERNKE